MKRLLIVIALLANTLNSTAQDTKQIDDYLNLLEANNKLMATMAITSGGQPFYHKAFGFADVSNSIKNHETTKFRIGSITKAFTAVMIFQLIDDGKLTLETSLSKFFPEIKNASKITIAHLLNHSSGLYNITNAPDFGEWMLKPSTKDQMLERIKSYKLDFESGAQTAYSNTNYLILGYIVEEIDKSSYAEALKVRITDKI